MKQDTNSEEDELNPHHDVILNVGLNEALIRGIITIILPILSLLIYKGIAIYIAPFIVYLYLTVMMRYDPIKYLIRKYITHSPLVKRKPYGMDINYPEETI